MLVTRYLLKNLLTVTLFVALTLTLVIWLTQSLKLLELIANSDAPLGLFGRLVILTLPSFLEIILPLSLVISTLFTYNKFITDNELIVMRASGVDQYGLAKPALVLALVVSLLVFSFTTWLSPKANEQFQELRLSIKTQYSSFLLREGVFNSFGSSITVFLREREDNGDMLGLIIHDTRKKDAPPVTIIAKKGRVAMEGDVPTIIVFDGIRQQMDAATGSLSKLYFSRYMIEVSGFEGVAQRPWRKASERSLFELFNPDMTNKIDRDNRIAFLAEAHSRIVTPWNALSFTLTVLAIMLLGPFNRRGQNRKILVAALAVVALQALSLIITNMAKDNILLVPLLYINTFGPIILCSYLLHVNGEQHLAQMLRQFRKYMHRVSEKGIIS